MAPHLRGERRLKTHGRFRDGVLDAGGPVPHRRNERYVDAWSLVHLLASGGLAVVLGPFLGLLVAVLWEPFEVLLVSPLLARRGVVFGNESLRNSLMDVLFDCLGVLTAALFLLPVWDPLAVGGVTWP